jgi:hypothetical protein
MTAGHKYPLNQGSDLPPQQQQQHHHHHHHQLPGPKRKKAKRSSQAAHIGGGLESGSQQPLQPESRSNGCAQRKQCFSGRARKRRRQVRCGTSAATSAPVEDGVGGLQGCTREERHEGKHLLGNEGAGEPLQGAAQLQQSSHSQDSQHGHTSQSAVQQQQPSSSHTAAQGPAGVGAGGGGEKRRKKKTKQGLKDRGGGSQAPNGEEPQWRPGDGSLLRLIPRDM